MATALMPIQAHWGGLAGVGALHCQNREVAYTFGDVGSVRSLSQQHAAHAGWSC